MVLVPVGPSDRTVVVLLVMAGDGEIVYKTVDLGVAGGGLAGRQATELLHDGKNAAARGVHVCMQDFGSLLLSNCYSWEWREVGPFV